MAGPGGPSPAEAWGTDILRERSFVWLVASRFFILVGGAVLIALSRSLPRAVAGPERETSGQLAARSRRRGGRRSGPLATLPAARLSDAIGRKKVIYVALRARRRRA